jgi:hypothetical protein
MKDPIREFLKKKGCPEHVVKGGLEGLIEAWETVVTEISHGYDLTLDDYLNDMDGRQLIEEVIPFASTPGHKALIKKLGRLDKIVRTLLVPTEKSLWGESVTKERNWTAETNWWYFTQPKHPGPDLRDELEP